MSIAKLSAITILRKELKRFFTDRRLLFASVIIPGLTICLVYGLLGDALMRVNAVDDGYQPVMYTVNQPDSFALFCEQAGEEFTSVGMEDMSRIKALISEKQADLLVVFPQSFDDVISMQMSGEHAGELPVVEVYYNSSKRESVNQYQIVMGMLDQYEFSLAPLFHVNKASDSGQSPFDLATDKDAISLSFAQVLPMLLILVLFSGCSSVAPESIAGEKERGTITQLLATPMARWELVFGKVMALACTASVCGLSSFVGIVLTLPKALGYSAGATASLYAFTDYLKLLAVILSTVMLFVAVLANLSALARTVKEANMYAAPLVLVVALAGVSGMLSAGGSENAWHYLVPVLNSAQCMAGVFALSSNMMSIVLTSVTNIIISIILIIILTMVLNNDRTIYS